MKQEVTSTQQFNNISIPENYYSKSEYSYWYDHRLIDKSYSGEPSPTERFIDSIYEQLPINAPKHLSQRKKKALNNIISNLISAYRSNLMLSISRDRTKYSIPKQYGMDHYTHTFIVSNGIDVLNKHGYIYQEKGYYDITREKGKITRFCATEKLIDEYFTFSNVSALSFKLVKNKESGSNIICIEPRFRKLEYAAPIKLKNEDKKLIAYLPTRKIRQMRNNLNEYNSLLSRVEVIGPYRGNYTTTIPLPLIRDFDINYATDKRLNQVTYYKVLDTYLYRIFNNGDFKQGGRFYGAGYQGIGGDDRKLILINEFPTTECDYKAIQPRLCYHLLGKEYTEDPYSAVCVKDELRDPTKKLMNIMLNAKDNNAAIGAFKKWLNKEEEVRDILIRNDLDERKLVQKIFDKHKPISGYFNSRKGVELQYIDSCIAEAVLMHFTKQGIPCLCVHDSFIVEKRYREELGNVMKEEYKRLIGFNCNIKFNK